MPSTELVLPFNVDGHWIIPTIPTPTPLVPLPFSSSNLQQLRQRVLGSACTDSDASCIVALFVGESNYCLGMPKSKLQVLYSADLVRYP